MGRYRFLISPGWIFRHLIALALAVALVNLGLWQLRRLDQKRSHNRVLADRATAAVVDVGAGQPTGDPGSWPTAWPRPRGRTAPTRRCSSGRAPSTERRAPGCSPPWSWPTGGP